MGKFRFRVTMTLDGYVAGPNQSVDNPLGEGGGDIHEWQFRTTSFQETHAGQGGKSGVDDEILRELSANVGATIMGRNMFGGGPGPWAGGTWRGWWGENPPFHTPVFVLTHYSREPLVMQGGTTFYFVTEGIESALRQAGDAAGDKDVLLGGGANVAQQYLAAGLLDEVDLHLVPLLLGGGERLFVNLTGSGVRLEQVRAVQGNGVTHLKYRLLK